MWRRCPYLFIYLFMYLLLNSYKMERRFDRYDKTQLYKQQRRKNI